MKKSTIYYIFTTIPKKIYDKKYKYLLPNKIFSNCKFLEDSWYGLYAWTLKKSLVTEFFQIRDKKKYELKKVEIDINGEEFKEFKNDYAEYKLRKSSFDHYYDGKIQKVDIVVTKNEYTQTNMDLDGPSNYDEHILGEIKSDVNFNIFKDDILQSLDKLNYTEFIILRNGTSSDIDEYSFQNSFNLTLFGHPRINYQLDELNFLLKLYEEMF